MPDVVNSASGFEVQKLSTMKKITNFYITMTMFSAASAIYSLVFVNEKAFLLMFGLTSLMFIASYICIKSKSL
tara:strand:- start:1272 stop:1490 length:219 start_codon:yes stop_codon:yes gene_type:complete